MTKNWCLERLNELMEIKKSRPLTDEENEQLWYCKETLSSYDAESYYLNGNQY